MAPEEPVTSGDGVGVIAGSIAMTPDLEPYLDLHGAGRQRGDLFLHAVSNAGVHGGAPGEDIVGIEILPDVNVTLHDAVVGGFMDASRLHPCKGGMGHDPWVVGKTQVRPGRAA